MTPILNRLGLACAGLLALSACGSETHPAIDYIRSQKLLSSEPKNPKTVVTADQTAQTLAATDAPVEFVNLESRESQALMIGIERNGPYYTYGTATRQSIVLRNGMITATRGLGGDLMSSEEDALYRVVQSRHAGSASYQMRFLTPEDVISTLNVSCTVSAGGPTAIVAGAINSSGTTMTANCQGDGASFSNTYVVDARGNILAARQWLGHELGYVGNQAMRR
ncbi:YjbF family lipoprotein [Tropicibacter sp. S64]|uniref:YjbF family lipoprotein n=1 Tax=Tropicibacter sp. S64 TaxID=3415122 RepID=UPI003C79E048